MTLSAAGAQMRIAIARVTLSVLWIFPVVLSSPYAVWAQNRTTGETLSEQTLSAHSSAEHHYNSPAQRAEDDLLIVKVKSAIADSGLANDYPLTVDADHGRVTLTGVLGSRRDVHRMLDLVSGVQGVKSINDRLTWVKKQNNRGG
jgi:osmotically-inducible protein OsmY